MEQREKAILSGSEALETRTQTEAEVAKAEVVETVSPQDNASKPEVVMSEPEMTGQEPAKPEVGNAESSSMDEKPMLTSHLPYAQPEAAKAETSRKPEAGRVPKRIPEMTSSDSNRSDRETRGDDAEAAEVPRPKPEVDESTSGSTANGSDNDEIAEILRRAPAPSVLQQEEVGEKVEKVDRTEIVMRKTFTASISSGQEFFVPIPDELCPSTSTASPPPPPLPLHRLRHPLPSSAGVQRKRSSSVDSSFSSSVAPPTASTGGAEGGKGTEGDGEKNKKTGGGHVILSKAQNEARDLTSSMRHLQSLLENLSSFTELEIASFRPQATARAVVVVTVAMKDDEAPSP